MLISQGLWYTKRPAQSHDHSCWKKLQNNLQWPDIFALLWRFFFIYFANISSYKALFCNFFQQEWPRDWAGRFAYHKPSKFNKMGDNFFMDFSFFAHRFFKENLWIFFSQMPDALGVCGTMCKVKKEENLFWGDSQLPSQIARTRVRLLYTFC